SAMPHDELPLGPPPGPSAQMRVHLIDVGQGAATLVEFSCGVVLVDTGGEQNGSFDSERRLLDYLDRFFAHRKHLHSTIALLVLTHPHIDHTRSALAVFRRYHVENVVTDGLTTSSGGEQAGDLLAAAEHARIGDERIAARDVPATGLHDRIIDPISCPDGDPDIRAFWGAVDGRDVDWDHDALDNANNARVVVRFRLGRASFLITGDLEQAGIAEVVKRFAGELRADVWQVGHHGSWNATTKPLLDAIQPKLALIAMGRVERQETWSAWAYGHPRRESIELLERGLTGPPRPAIHVEIGVGAREFQPHEVTAPIYATGWDGDVHVTLHADGSLHVH
ncbi:MAG: MBL fold metallo-hydrolase, partial [Kofleriaceae bacterium]